MKDRNLLKQKFLVEHKLEKAELISLPADASYRTYDRLKLADKSYILMDAPPPQENVKPFIKVANYLSQNGISSPKIFADDVKNGFLLLEDFGDDSYIKLLQANEEEFPEKLLYENAIDLLLYLHKLPVPDGILPYYDDELLLNEVNQLTEWYVPILNGEPINKKLQEEFEIIWRHLLQYTRFLSETVVLRDYHVNNLMWLDNRSGIKRVGVLDFQDAVIGSPVYDMVSLLEDVRRDVSDELAQNMITRYLTTRADEITRKDFLASYAILGAQRNLKIIGMCARKAVKDKNSTYLNWLPRIWRYLEKDLKHPLLLPLKAWLDKVISPQVRKPAITPYKLGQKRQNA
jgi:hypothetical protein